MDAVLNRKGVGQPVGAAGTKAVVLYRGSTQGLLSELTTCTHTTWGSLLLVEEAAWRGFPRARNGAEQAEGCWCSARGRTDRWKGAAWPGG